MLAALTAAMIGCIKAPDVVLTDQRTALEQQAAGEYRALENQLNQSAVSPKGEDIPREALEAKNPDQNTSTLGDVVQLYSAVRSDAEWVDEMLVAGCLGEGRDGLLAPNPQPDLCKEDLDLARLAQVTERMNLHRRQLWQVIGERKPKASQDEIRTTWREIHLKRVVCDGLIESADQRWEAKKC
ncbi:MAG: hypothetical protein AAGC55_34120 [Myxococcota bacterium]